MPRELFGLSILPLLAFYPAQLPGYTSNGVLNKPSPLNRETFVAHMDYVKSARSNWTGRDSWAVEIQKDRGLSITGSIGVDNSGLSRRIRQPASASPATR